MTEGDRPQTHAVLDVGVAVQVLDPGAAAADDHRGHVLRVLVGAAGVGVRTAGDEGVQPGLRRVRPVERRGARWSWTSFGLAVCIGVVTADLLDRSSLSATFAAKKPSAYRLRVSIAAQPHQPQEQLVVPPVAVQLATGS